MGDSENLQKLRTVLAKCADLIREGEGHSNPIPVSEMRQKIAAIDAAVFTVNTNHLASGVRFNTGSNDTTTPSDTTDYYRKLLTNLSNKIKTNTTKLSVDDIILKTDTVSGLYKASDQFYATLTIPSSVMYINGNFLNRNQKIHHLEIPDSVLKIEANAFTSARFSTVRLSNQVQQIYSSTFADSFLQSIDIPNSVTIIDYHAFYSCPALSSITIPESVSSIGPEVFARCPSLRTITVSANNPYYDSRNNCNAIIKTDTNTLITGCYETVIPDSVTAIDSQAFQQQTYLHSINIPNSVVSIGSEAFNYAGLTSITLPSSLQRIPYQCFANCSLLTSVTLPASLTEIGTQAFLGTTRLTTLNLPDSVITLGEGAFVQSGLESITLPTNLQTIGDQCFAETSLTSIVIPSSITTIPNDCFSRCTKLQSVTLPNSLQSIKGGAFNNCSNLSSITIPDSVTRIGSYAFSQCSNLSSVTLPSSLPNIELGCFRDTTSLRSITLPSSVRSIGHLAFNGSGIENITLSRSLREICEAAFAGSYLVAIDIPKSVTSVEQDAFTDCNYLSSITLHYDGWFDDLANDEDYITNVLKSFADSGYSEITLIALGDRTEIIDPHTYTGGGGGGSGSGC